MGSRTAVAGRAKLRLSRGFPDCLVCDVTPCDVTPNAQSFESLTMCAATGILKQIMRRYLVGQREIIEREFVGLTLFGQGKREAPAQAELRPTFAGSRGLSRANLPLLVMRLPYFRSVNGILKPQARQLEFPRI